MQERTIHSQVELTPKILDRYVAREFLISYIIALLVVLSLRIILDLFVQLDEFVEAKSDQAAPGALTALGYILDYYGPKTFEYFRDFSGMIILLAAVFSLARMTRQNELTAVLASGVSLKRVIAPIVLLGFVLNMLMVIDQEFILPRYADKLVRRHDEMNRLRSLSINLLPDKNNALLTANEFDPQEKSLRGVQIILRAAGRATGVITASAAHWDESRQRWRLTEGQLLIMERTTESVSRDRLWKIDYYPSDIPSVSADNSQSQPATLLSPDYLWLQRHKNFKTLMSGAELSNLMKLELKPAQRAETITEKHFRFTDPIINMVMLLLGLPLLVSRERRSTKTSILLTMLGAGGCFIATFACKLMIGEDIFGGFFGSPYFSYALLAWVPIIVFMPLAVLALDSIKT